eukprot:scaffold194232_cov44-Prasinocladus_malaysianus.AAC.1
MGSKIRKLWKRENSAWRRPHCSRRVLRYWVVVGVCGLAQFVSMVALEGFVGCCDVMPCSTAAREASEGIPVCSDLPPYVNMATWVVALVTLGYDFLCKCWRLARPRQPQANHWMPAMSKEFLDETVRAIDSTQEMVGFCLLMGFVISTASLWLATYSWFLPCRGCATKVFIFR